MFCGTIQTPEKTLRGRHFDLTIVTKARVRPFHWKYARLWPQPLQYLELFSLPAFRRLGGWLLFSQSKERGQNIDLIASVLKLIQSEGSQLYLSVVGHKLTENEKIRDKFVITVSEEKPAKSKITGRTTVGRDVTFGRTPRIPPTVSSIYCTNRIIFRKTVKWSCELCSVEDKPTTG